MMPDLRVRNKQTKASKDKTELASSDERNKVNQNDIPHKLRLKM